MKPYDPNTVLVGCFYPVNSQAEDDKDRGDELYEKDVDKLIERIPQIPIRFEHGRENVGSCIDGYKDKYGNAFARFKINDTVIGRQVWDKIQAKSHAELSLSHIRGSPVPTEISVCSRGARAKCWIVKCSHSTSASKSSGDLEEVSIQIETEDVFNTLYGGIREILDKNSEKEKPGDVITREDSVEQTKMDIEPTEQTHGSHTPTRPVTGEADSNIKRPRNDLGQFMNDPEVADISGTNPRPKDKPSVMGVKKTKTGGMGETDMEEEDSKEQTMATANGKEELDYSSPSSDVKLPGSNPVEEMALIWVESVMSEYADDEETIQMLSKYLQAKDYKGFQIAVTTMKTSEARLLKKQLAQEKKLQEQEEQHRQQLLQQQQKQQHQQDQERQQHQQQRRPRHGMNGVRPISSHQYPSPHNVPNMSRNARGQGGQHRGYPYGAFQRGISSFVDKFSKAYPNRGGHMKAASQLPTVKEVFTKENPNADRVDPVPTNSHQAVKPAKYYSVHPESGEILVNASSEYSTASRARQFEMALGEFIDNQLEKLQSTSSIAGDYYQEIRDGSAQKDSQMIYEHPSYGIMDGAGNQLYY